MSNSAAALAYESGRGIHVLLLARSREDASNEGQILGEDGFVVETCGSGAEALSRLQDRPFDVVVDLAAPSGESFELYAGQRSDPAIAGIPRVVAVESNGARARSSADVRLVRPFTAADLRVAIERALLERERRALKQRLEETERLALLGTVAARVGHELNNPLAFALGNVELAEEALESALGELERVENGDGSALLRRRLDSLVACLRDGQLGLVRMQRLVSELALFSRRSDGERHALDIRAVVETSLAMAKRQIDERATVTCQYGEPAFVMGDEPRLGQLFLNLLVNAAQAIRPGDAPENHISVRTYLEGREVVVEVEDSGQGMSKAQLLRIFEPFYTTKPAGTGTGLGLPICRDIVEEHEGRLDVQSEPGRGSCFSVRLPTLPPRPSEVQRV